MEGEGFPRSQQKPFHGDVLRSFQYCKEGGKPENRISTAGGDTNAYRSQVVFGKMNAVLFHALFRREFFFNPESQGK